MQKIMCCICEAGVTYSTWLNIPEKAGQTSLWFVLRTYSISPRDVYACTRTNDVGRVANGLLQLLLTVHGK
jgi:hypothetical protein